MPKQLKDGLERLYRPPRTFFPFSSFWGVYSLAVHLDSFKDTGMSTLRWAQDAWIMDVHDPLQSHPAISAPLRSLIITNTA
jgi:hypothetical protein